MSPASSQQRPARELELLMRRIRANDQAAWTELVGRFDKKLRTIARSYRLSPADVDDVLQTVWLRLCSRVDTLRDPNAVAGWLVTTTRRASLDVLQKRVREQLTDDLELLEGTDPEQPDSELLAAERSAVLRRALGTLPPHQRRLMVLLTSAPTDYRKVSTTLDMPVGSIGPTRARTLDRLRRHPELHALHVTDAEREMSCVTSRALGARHA